ncbi:MAG: adenosylmethionine--8-amino-7-oxononanoate transaminase, partial [Betaproteobacteria bacterium]|nr:adenosylmethionine--8-amino-7-oxononanoate transaminase [Betaproteobacteria bacterium]
MTDAHPQASETPGEALTRRSRAAVWHPCTQMKHHETLPMLPVVAGEGAWLVDANGRRVLDACSSWWTNLFGHAHPDINAALVDQLHRIEHVMLAGCTHAPVVELSERLSTLTGLGHAFYGSDGASAVEIALKMSFHHWRNAGHPAKRRFVSLQDSYHGETLGALAVTDVAIFRDAYGLLLAENILTTNPSTGAHPRPKVAQAPRQSLGFVQSSSEQAQLALRDLETLFEQRHDEIAAFIVEPLVQGAAGMRMHAPDFLRGARALCDRYGVHLIADEIMTGFGRTGTMLAVEQAGIVPDVMCLSKGLTGGYLPLSCVLTREAIYAAFYDDATARGFLHSHSYTGSALACRAALATLDLFEQGGVLAENRKRAARYTQLCAPLANHERVREARHLGMIWAFDVDTDDPAFSRKAFARALDLGVLLRPIG